ncbi:MAG: hypothetical protein WBM29_09070 [Candidatus Deferrimicrobium sp.]
MAFARAALALAVLLMMLGSAAGCGRKAMPEPRNSESPSTGTLIGER